MTQFNCESLKTHVHHPRGYESLVACHRRCSSFGHGSCEELCKQAVAAVDTRTIVFDATTGGPVLHSGYHVSDYFRNSDPINCHLTYRIVQTNGNGLTASEAQLIRLHNDDMIEVHQTHY